MKLECGIRLVKIALLHTPTRELELELGRRGQLGRVSTCESTLFWSFIQDEGSIWKKDRDHDGDASWASGRSACPAPVQLDQTLQHEVET